jgi:hypothetical protein
MHTVKIIETDGRAVTVVDKVSEAVAADVFQALATWGNPAAFISVVQYESDMIRYSARPGVPGVDIW